VYAIGSTEQQQHEDLVWKDIGLNIFSVLSVFFSKWFIDDFSGPIILYVLVFQKISWSICKNIY